MIETAEGMKTHRLRSATVAAALMVGAGFAVGSDAAAAEVIDFTPSVQMTAHGRLLFESSLREDERALVAASVAQAEANITRAYGERRAPPATVIWCKTYSCALYFGGPSTRSFATRGGPNARRGQYDFDGPAVVMLRQVRAPGRLLAVETLTHELSHLEFFARLGTARVPAWFNEGVATYLGGEHRCTEEAQGVAELSTLDSAARWNAHVNAGGAVLKATYCQARNTVADWIAARGGFGAVPELLRRVAAGELFASVYHAPGSASIDGNKWARLVIGVRDARAEAARINAAVAGRH